MGRIYTKEKRRSAEYSNWIPSRVVIRCESCNDAVSADGKTFCPLIGKNWACDKYSQSFVNPLASVQSSRIIRYTKKVEEEVGV